MDKVNFISFPSEERSDAESSHINATTNVVVNNKNHHSGQQRSFAIHRL